MSTNEQKSLASQRLCAVLVLVGMLGVFILMMLIGDYSRIADKPVFWAGAGCFFVCANVFGVLISIDPEADNWQIVVNIVLGFLSVLWSLIWLHN